MSPAVRRAVFLDRDGVINKPVVRDGKPYPPATVDEFEIFPDVPEAIALLRSLGFDLFVVTNQPDVARGTQSREAIEAMHDKLRHAVGLQNFYVCFHDDKDDCACRKPKPGQLLAIAAERDISLPDSFMVGDRWRDVDCGAAAGCRTVFIDRGYTEKLRAQPTFIVSDLLSAARVIDSEKST